MYSVAQLIERFIEEMGTDEQPGIKPLGETHLYSLRRIAREPIGLKVAEELKKSDVVDHVKWRRLTVCAATAMQDITALSGVLKYAPSAWEDCSEVSDAAIAAAKPMLVKVGLIGKSTPRTRRPTDEEIERLLDLSMKQDQHPLAKINMVCVILFALASTRRIGEICRIQHGDINWTRRTYKVRDMKHPTKKKGNDKEFALFPELAAIIQAQPRLNENDPTERVFPFNSKSCSHRYTEAKKKLGIVGLRFHDNRAEAISRWLKKLPPHKVKLISGHETTLVLERVYDRRDAADLHEDLAQLSAMTAENRLPA